MAQDYSSVNRESARNNILNKNFSSLLTIEKHRTKAKEDIIDEKVRLFRVVGWGMGYVINNR